MSPARTLALLLLPAACAFTRPATAQTSAGVLLGPPVEVQPDPVYQIQEETESAEIPAAGEGSAPAFDWSAGPLARQAGSSGPASLAIVMTESLLHPGNHQSRGWQRFFQGNPEEAPALTVSCGRGDDRYRAMESYRLGVGPDGAMRYAHQTAWLNQKRCKGLLLRSVVARAEPLAGGLAYAYRTRCARCAEGARETLHVVMPSTHEGRVLGGAWGYWTRLLTEASAPLEPGSSATLVATFDAEAILAWNRVAPSPLPVRETSLRVEISHATGEAAPTVLAEAR